MDLMPLVLQVGDCVTGWGEIRTDDDGVWFVVVHAVPLMFRGDGPPAPRPVDAVRLLHHVPSAVATDFRDDGSIPGWATVTGIWLDGVIDVLEQTPVPPASARRTFGPRWVTPPGPKPVGGWPRGSAEDLYKVDTQALREDENCVSAIVYRPHSNRAVMVVAATDVGMAESMWRPVLGRRVLIVQSQWSKGQLAAVRDELVENWDDWTIGLVSEVVDEHSQTRVEALILRVMPAMAAWARAVPDGILQIHPTLRPDLQA
ncbi:hypothetical protein SAMN04515671_1444 [Nakamurella panacisegetis]|uniref:Uncharacterized protein n=1 Tax=Nakamurella panacisegetis TaxID=1090615 RepID=A0A1H0KVF0_9ACTN|nr:hypothetical protein [Nakamurella panacisegetis]SDO59919.1 hypothetical protein SAMN04515671_1444 [Nakamurella panacisegetis]